MKKKPEWVPIDTLILDPEIQQRWVGDPHAIREYAEAHREGAEFPPIEAVEDPEGRRWVWDGFHRLPAAREAGKTEVLVNLQPGTRRDALLKSCSANQEHGLRRTRSDMRKAVNTLLDDAEWGQLSHREIARLAGVSHTFVNSRVMQRENEARQRAQAQERAGKEAQEQQAERLRREARDARVVELREALVPRLREAAESDIIARISETWLTEMAGLSPEEQEAAAARMVLGHSVSELDLSQGALGLLRQFHIKTLGDLREMANRLDDICWERPQERQEIESKLAEWAWLPAEEAGRGSGADRELAGNVSTPEAPTPPDQPEPPALPGLESGIEALDFSVRTYNCLKKTNIQTVGDLVQQTEADLMNIRNFGRKCVLEVRDKLAAWGLCLAGEPLVDDVVPVDDEDEVTLFDPESWRWVPAVGLEEPALWVPDWPDGPEQPWWAKNGRDALEGFGRAAIAALGEELLRSVAVACPEEAREILARLQALLDG